MLFRSGLVAVDQVEEKFGVLAREARHDGPINEEDPMATGQLRLRTQAIAALRAVPGLAWIDDSAWGARAGWALWLGNAAAFAGLPLSVLVLNALQIRPEERILRERFGDEWTRYAARVRRWM